MSSAVPAGAELNIRRWDGPETVVALPYVRSCVRRERFGVGLTINQLHAPPSPLFELGRAGADWHPTRLGELMPVASRDDAGLGEEMRRVNIADSRLWAYRLEMVAQLAARRRDTLDRVPGQPGAAAVSYTHLTLPTICSV